MTENDFFILLPAIAGAFIYRLRGMDQKYLPRPFIQIAFALPYAIISGPWFFFPVLIVTTLAVLTGHGRFMSLGLPYLKGSPERIEFIIQPLQEKIPVYWYKVLGLCLSGFVITLPAGLATLNPFIALSGILKGPAYMIGFKLNGRTEIGEWLTGAFLWGSLIVMIIYPYDHNLIDQIPSNHLG